MPSMQGHCENSRQHPAVTVIHGGPFKQPRGLAREPGGWSLGSSLTFLAGSLELHPFARLYRGERSLGIYCSRAVLPEGDSISCWSRQCPRLLSTSQTLSLPPRDPPGSDKCLLPVSEMKKGSKKHMTSLSVEDTVDALSQIPWAYLSHLQQFPAHYTPTDPLPP